MNKQVTMKDRLDAMPDLLREELEAVVYNSKLQGNKFKFSAKSNNKSDTKSNLLSPTKFLDYIHGNGSLRPLLRGYLYSQIFDDPEEIFGVLKYMYGLLNSDEPVMHQNHTIQDQLNWSGVAGSSIEKARGERYWKLNKKDIELLRYIKVARAGTDASTGTLVVYIRACVHTHTYTLVSPLKSTRPNDIVAILSSIVEDGKSLLDRLEKEYMDYVEDRFDKGKSRFDGCVYGAMRIQVTRDGEEITQWCAYTFQDYLRNIVKSQLLVDTRLRLEHEPVGISSTMGEPTFYYFNREQVKRSTGETPHWDSWMKVIPNEFHDVFMAWIYSIFVPKNKGRQALWLHSEGYDGKSQMTLALTKYMNGHGVGSINSRIAKSQFAYSAAYGKRLLVFGDCQNDMFLRTSVAHSILGGDPAPVEFKNKDAFTSRVFCKMLIASNKAPRLDINAGHELTRLIYIPLQKPPENIQAKFLETDDEGRVIYDSRNNPYPIGYSSGIQGEKTKELNEYLYEEMDNFLNKCRTKYLQLCPHHKEIVTSDKVRQALYTICASEESEVYETYIDENFEFVKDDTMFTETATIRAEAKRYFKLSPEMKDLFDKFNVVDFMSTFERIAIRKLREAGTPVNSFKTVVQDGKRCYPYVKIKQLVREGGVI